MEKQYYTPEISEFHHGFEFEYLPPIWAAGEQLPWQKYNWSRATGHICLASNCIYIANVAMKDNRFRVKFLDHDDILECGWEVENPGIYKIRQFKLTGQIEYLDVEIVQTLSNENKAGLLQITIYDGIVKNKSELLKLMQRLGIIPNAK